VSCDSFSSSAGLLRRVPFTLNAVSVGGSIVRSCNADPSIGFSGEHAKFWAVALL
jgi:hypothetical protein